MILGSFNHINLPKSSRNNDLTNSLSLKSVSSDNYIFQENSNSSNINSASSYNFKTKTKKIGHIKPLNIEVKDRISTEEEGSTKGDTIETIIQNFTKVKTNLRDKNINKKVNNTFFHNTKFSTELELKEFNEAESPKLLEIKSFKNLPSFSIDNHSIKRKFPQRFNKVFTMEFNIPINYEDSIKLETSKSKVKTTDFKKYMKLTMSNNNSTVNLKSSDKFNKEIYKKVLKKQVITDYDKHCFRSKPKIQIKKPARESEACISQILKKSLKIESDLNTYIKQASNSFILKNSSIRSSNIIIT